jgi:hypothetical protein
VTFEGAELARGNLPECLEACQEHDDEAQWESLQEDLVRAHDALLVIRDCHRPGTGSHDQHVHKTIDGVLSAKSKESES